MHEGTNLIYTQPNKQGFCKIPLCLSSIKRHYIAFQFDGQGNRQCRVATAISFKAHGLLHLLSDRNQLHGKHRYSGSYDSLYQGELLSEYRLQLYLLPRPLLPYDFIRTPGLQPGICTVRRVYDRDKVQRYHAPTKHPVCFYFQKSALLP